MKLTCTQFEGLITFYLDGELSNSLRQAFEEHIKECPACAMKFKVIKSIIGDIKTAYDRIISGSEKEQCIDITPVQTCTKPEGEDVTMTELSAYIDNELPDENNIKIRRNIIARPSLRAKLKKMYKLRKMLSESFIEQKKRLKTDYSKTIIQSVNKSAATQQFCFHCILFLLVVLVSVLLSVWAIIKLL